MLNRPDNIHLHDEPLVQQGSREAAHSKIWKWLQTEVIHVYVDRDEKSYWYKHLFYHNISSTANRAKVAKLHKREIRPGKEYEKKNQILEIVEMKELTNAQIRKKKYL